MVEDLRDGLRRVVSSWPRRLLVVGTPLLGTAVAGAVAVAGTSQDRTLPGVLTLVQSVMSVLTPLVGVVLVHDLRRKGRVRGGDIAGSVLAGLLVAIALGLTGAVVGAAAATTEGLGRLTLAGVLVQCVALITGTGLGLLIPSRAWAFLATLAIPLGLWRLFGSTDALEPGRGWLTQYESARRLLADAMTPLHWLQFAVMVLLWGPVLHAVGVRVLRGRGGRPGHPNA